MNKKTSNPRSNIDLSFHNLYKPTICTRHGKLLVGLNHG